MCATYTPARPGDIRIKFGALEPTFEYKPRIWPGYDAPILLGGVGDQLTPHRAQFGLLPFFAKERKQRYSTFNARSEDVAKKPTFREAWRGRRFCLVPVQRFFEPNYATGKAVWWGIERVDGEPFNVAGIWDRWKPAAGDAVMSFTMLTVNAQGHPLMHRFHAPGDEKRSIVVFDEAGSDHWLVAETDADARGLLKLFPAEEFRAAPATELEPAAAK